MSLRWIPNAICIVRIALVAPIVLSLLAQRYEVALLLFAVAGGSDGLDGFLAKRFSWQTRLGGLLDPIADKLLIAAALFGLALEFKTWLIYVPAAMIIARDVFMTWFRATPRGRSAIVPSNLAKWKTGFEFAAIIGLMLPLATLRPSLDDEVATGSDVLAIVAIVTVVGLLWVAAALSWWTAGQYMKAAGSAPTE